MSALAKKKNRPVHLLLGNGFSVAYNKDIFSYNALYRFIDELDDAFLKKLFEVIKTKNFEIVMQQLDIFCDLIEAFDPGSALKEKVQGASDNLKESIIDAVKALHPEHVFKIAEEQSEACANFLKTFLDEGNHIFTTNYDVLLYWVLMRNQSKISNAIDGFGRERVNPDEYVSEEELEYSELRWGKHKDQQNVHYLHGALPIFDTGTEIVKEEYKTGQQYLMTKIEERLKRKEYPIFVTAGNGEEKLIHILHNRYLTHCYETLCAIEGSLVTFGFNFGEYDEHIIDAINVAAKQGKKYPPKLWSIYIGVYSDSGKKHIERIASKFKCKVHIFDSKTVPVWDEET